MTLLLEKGRYRVRRARGDADVSAALDLRRICFRAGRSSDRDAFDDLFEHVLVERGGDPGPIATFRVLIHPGGAALGAGYLGVHYGLSGWRQVEGRIIEMGRFCLRPGVLDADVVRAAWAGLARMCRAEGVGHLVGTSTFDGMDAAQHAGAFRQLFADHQGPVAMRPTVASQDVVQFSDIGPSGDTATPVMLPGLLRSYVRMGGWVGDHAVVDRDLRSLHVFTALDLAAIPERRKRSLAVLAGE